jgi:hypothetical protein
MTTRIDFSADTPPEYSSAVLSIIEHFRWIIPTWCHALSVEYKWSDADGDGRTRADCLAEPQYRQARIRFYASFLEMSDADRKNVIVHELLHIVTAPLARATEDALWAATMSDDARKLATKMRNEAEECVVEDLTCAVIARDELIVTYTVNDNDPFVSTPALR